MSKLDELEKLAKLKKRGVLTAAEFEKQKKILLGQDDTKADSPVPANLPCCIKCADCSYKGRMNYIKYRMSPAFYIYFFTLFIPTFVIAMFVSLLGGLLLAFILGCICRALFDITAEIDTYECPKCGHFYEVPLKNSQVKTLKQNGLYHKNP